MNLLEKFNQERLKRTEKSLTLAGCGKCAECGYWVDKVFISENNICDLCNEK